MEGASDQLVESARRGASNAAQDSPRRSPPGRRRFFAFSGVARRLQTAVRHPELSGLEDSKIGSNVGTTDTSTDSSTLAIDAWSSGQWCVSIVTGTRFVISSEQRSIRIAALRLVRHDRNHRGNFSDTTCQTCKSVTTESPSLSTVRRISSGKSDDGGVQIAQNPLVSRNSV